MSIQYHMEVKNHFGPERLVLLDGQLHLQQLQLQSMLNNSPENVFGPLIWVLRPLANFGTNLSTIKSPKPDKSIFSRGKISWNIEWICSKCFIGIFTECRCILKTRFWVFCDFVVGYLESKWRDSKIYNFVLFKFTQCWIIISRLSLLMAFNEIPH